MFLDSRIIDVSVLATPAQIQHVNGVDEDSPLDLLIEWTVRHEARRLVHLDEPWFRLLVQKDVNAQDL